MPFHCSQEPDRQAPQPRFALGLIAILLLAGSTSSHATSPNIVLILTDDQGWSQVSQEMDPRRTDSKSSYLMTPAFNRLMDEGMRFSNGYSPTPICTPTRRCIQSGTTAFRSGAEFGTNWVTADHLTIPDALRSINPNYVCAHFGKWGAQQNCSPAECGYDASDGITDNEDGTWGTLPDSVHVIDNVDPKQSNSLATSAINFMTTQKNAGNPFFMQVSYYAVHTNLVTTQAAFDKYTALGTPDREYPIAFAAMLDDMDRSIGDILDAIESLEIDDNTYVILTSDNGGVNLDTVAGLPTENHPLDGHKHSLLEGGIRVPLIIKGPSITPGSVCHQPVVGYDFLPTFYDLAGGTGTLPDEIDGVSIKPLLTNPAADLGREPIYFLKNSNRTTAVRKGDYKLLVTWNAQGGVASYSLHDVSLNPVENGNDIAASNPTIANELMADLCAHIDEVYGPREPSGVIFHDELFTGLDSTDNNANPGPLNQWSLLETDANKNEDSPPSVEWTPFGLRTGFAADSTEINYQSGLIQLDATGRTSYRVTVTANHRDIGFDDKGIKVTLGARRWHEGLYHQQIKSRTFKRADDVNDGFTPLSLDVLGSDIFAANAYEGVNNFLNLRISHPGGNDLWFLESVRVEVIPFGLLIKQEGAPASMDLTWPVRARKVYDLLSSPDMTQNPTNWPVWEGKSGLTGGTVNDVYRSTDARRFFVLRERNPLLE